MTAVVGSLSCLLVPLLIISISVGGLHGQQLSQPCTTPARQPGYCINLQSCATLLQGGPPPGYFNELVTLVDYVRLSLCGYDGTTLLVCCTDPQAGALQFQETFTFSPLQQQPPPLMQMSSVPPSVATIAPNMATVVPPATVPVVDDVCGISNFTQTRVVGGMNAKLNSYPWIAALAYESTPGEPPKYLCAGSLITQRHVVTTAHCVNDQLLYVRLGEHDLASDADGARPLNVPIEQRIVHEAYVANLILNDIALLRLGVMVPISDQIRPICLPLGEPLRSADLTGYQPFLAGWGSVSYQGPAPTVLQEAQIPIVSIADCQANYRTLFPQQTFDERVLCAGAGGRDACQGDSGGPLMLPQQLQTAGTFYYVLIGLVSYGYECARDGFPGVYTRVAAFVPWIQAHTVN